VSLLQLSVISQTHYCTIIQTKLSTIQQ